MYLSTEIEEGCCALMHSIHDLCIYYFLQDELSLVCGLDLGLCQQDELQ